MTAFAAGGGVYHAIVGTLLQGLVCAVISIPIGVFVGIYLVEYGGGTRLGKITTFMVDILTGVPVDRGGAVHLRAVGRDAGLRSAPVSRCRWRWCC